MYFVHTSTEVAPFLQGILRGGGKLRQVEFLDGVEIAECPACGEQSFQVPTDYERKLGAIYACRRCGHAPEMERNPRGGRLKGRRCLGFRVSR